MDEKRHFERFNCKIKTKFKYYEGDPDRYDPSTATFINSKGTIFDISVGGIFIITDERVTVGMPFVTNFSLKKKKLQLTGHIVRTGLLKNNPSEIAIKFKKHSTHGDAYIAVEFDQPLDDLKYDDLK